MTSESRTPLPGKPNKYKHTAIHHCHLEKIGLNVFLSGSATVFICIAELWLWGFQQNIPISDDSKRRFGLIVRLVLSPLFNFAKLQLQLIVAFLFFFSLICRHLTYVETTCKRWPHFGIMYMCYQSTVNDHELVTCTGVNDSWWMSLLLKYMSKLDKKHKFLLNTNNLVGSP